MIERRPAVSRQSAAVSARRRRMTDRPDPVQIAAPPHVGETHQQHGEKHAQVEHRGQRQRAATIRQPTHFAGRDTSAQTPRSLGRPPTSRPRTSSVLRGRDLRRRSTGWPCRTRSPAGRTTPPRPRRSETPAPPRRTAGRTAPIPVPRPARRTRRSPASAGSATCARSSLPNSREASTNRNPTVANSAK